MANFSFLLVSLVISLPQIILSVHEENPLNVFVKQKPYKLQNRKTGLSVNQAETEIQELTTKQHLKAVMITNLAEDWFRVFCSSEYDHVFDNQRMNIGQSVYFEYEPVPSKEKIVFQCGLDYKGFFAVWDAVNNLLPYSDEDQQLHHFTILHDGVYINGMKIHGLGSSESRYLLCKENNSREYYPDCISGFVDKDMCNNLPSWMRWAKDGVASVVIDDFGCIVLYDDYNCSGSFMKIRVESRSALRRELQGLKNKVASVKGCTT